MNKKFSISSFLIGFYLVCGTSSVMAIAVSVKAPVEPQQETTIVQKAPVQPLIQEQATTIAAKKPVEAQRAISSEQKLKKLVTLLSGTKKAVEKFSALDSKEQLELLNGLPSEKKLELFNSLPFKKAVTIFNLLSPAEKLIAYPKLNAETGAEIRYNFVQSYGKKGEKLLQRTVKIKGNQTGKTINCSDYKLEDGKTAKAFKKYLQKKAAEAKATSEEVAEQNAEQNANSGKEAKATSENKRKAPFDDYLKLFKKPRQ